MSSYYRVLGVSRYANLDEIRKAYWSMAKRTHRESRRDTSTSDLTEIQRAYDTLSDSGRRQTYDALHTVTHSSASSEGVWAIRDRVPTFDDDVDNDFPSMATIARIVPRMRAAFFSTQPEVGETHTAHIELTPTEAFEGVQIPFHLSVRPTCPVCGGRGEIGTESCGLCTGMGTGRLPHQLHFWVPPGVRHGECLKFSVTPPFTAETCVEFYIAIQ